VQLDVSYARSGDVAIAIRSWAGAAAPRAPRRGSSRLRPSADARQARNRPLGSRARGAVARDDDGRRPGGDGRGRIGARRALDGQQQHGHRRPLRCDVSRALRRSRPLRPESEGSSLAPTTRGHRPIGPAHYAAERIRGAEIVELAELRGVYAWVDDEAHRAPMEATERSSPALPAGLTRSGPSRPSSSRTSSSRPRWPRNSAIPPGGISCNGTTRSSGASSPRAGDPRRCQHG
jgi:hypothetical protein